MLTVSLTQNTITANRTGKKKYTVHQGQSGEIVCYYVDEHFIYQENDLCELCLGLKQMVNR